MADLVSATVWRPKCIETTALGAAYLAGLTVGFWKDEAELLQKEQLGRKFSPSMENARRERLLSGWKRAVRAALAWAEEP